MIGSGRVEGVPGMRSRFADRFAAEAKRFSELSWGIVAQKPAGSPRR